MNYEIYLKISILKRRYTCYRSQICLAKLLCAKRIWTSRFGVLSAPNSVSVFLALKANFKCRVSGDLNLKFAQPNFSMLDGFDLQFWGVLDLKCAQSNSLRLTIFS